MTFPSYGVSFGDMVITIDGGGRMVASPARIVAPDERSAMANLQAENEGLKSTVQQYAAAFAAIKKQASPYATVTGLRKDKVVINAGGKTVEVEAGAHKGLRPGQTVKVSGETLQIIEVVDDAPAAGEVVPVVRVANATMAEVDRNGASRAVTYHGALEEGDRVVLDQSGSVVVANLGKPPDDCALSEPTGVTWDDIGGLAEAKAQLREAVEYPSQHAGLMARYGKKPIRGVLLYGSPGCGKSLLGKAAATALAAIHGASAAAGAFFYVKGPELLNMYVGNTEQNIRNLFMAARRHKKQHGFPALIFIDEADAILGKRSSGLGGVGAAMSNTVVPAFLAEMDGLQDSGALVLLATNRPDTLDPAIVRDGRIDRRIRVTRPSQSDAVDILTKHFACAPLTMPIDEAAHAAAAALYDKSPALYRVRKHSSVGAGMAVTLGHMTSGAMLAGVVGRATSIAMQRELDGQGPEGVTAADIRAAVAQTFSQSRDMNHADELAEFCDGWQHEVAGVEKVTHRASANAN